MLLSFERPFVGAFAVEIPRAMLRRCNGLAQAVPPESTEHGQTDNFEVLQELGISCRSLGDFPAGDTGLPTPGLGGALAAKERIRRVQPRYCQAKATKRGRTGG